MSHTLNFEVLSNFTNESFERELVNGELCGLVCLVRAIDDYVGGSSYSLKLRWFCMKMVLVPQ